MTSCTQAQTICGSGLERVFAWRQVGGIGIAPGGNINYKSGHAIFEATHGTAPKYAGLDKVRRCME